MDKHEPQSVLSASEYPSIRPDLPGDRLQDLRLLHALSEGNYPIRIGSDHLWKLQRLKEEFDLQVSAACGEEVIIHDIEIVHEIPITRIGLIARPLIFPHAFFTHLRKLCRAFVK